MFIICKSRLYRTFCKLNRYYRGVRAFLDKLDDAFINFQRAILRRNDKTALIRTWLIVHIIRDNRVMTKMQAYMTISSQILRFCNKREHFGKQNKNKKRRESITFNVTNSIQRNKHLNKLILSNIWLGFLSYLAIWFLLSYYSLLPFTYQNRID